MARTLTLPRIWTADDLAVLRRDWLKRPTVEIAVMLGRTVKAVVQKAFVLFGTSRERLPDHEAELRRLHAIGQSDGQIAQALDLGQSTISRWRRRLGLPAHYSPGSCTGEASRRVRATQQRLARKLGYPSWWHYVLSRRRLRHQYEEPGATTAAQVRMIRLLREHGPLTVAEAQALGGWLSPRQPGHHLRELVLLGLASRRRIDRCTHLYSLEQRRGGQP